MVSSRQDAPRQGSRLPSHERPPEGESPQGPRLPEDPSSLDEPRLTGHRVLLGKPGQLLIAVAILFGGAHLVEANVSEEDAVEETLLAAVPVRTEVSTAVTKALEESGIESESGGSPLDVDEARGDRGLVNLFKKVVPKTEPAPVPETPAEKPKPEGDDYQPIEDPKQAMKPFFDALDRTKRKQDGAITRVIHFGDSTIVADLITGTVRRKLQMRYGDAGHGFLLVGKPWDWYNHNDVKHVSSDTWRLNRVTYNPVKDKRYGLGGVTARAVSAGPWATFGTSDKGVTGKKLSRFDVFYLAHPRGGTLSVVADGSPLEPLDTKADADTDKVKSYSLKDAAHSVKIRSEGGGEVRLYGVALERDVPGVVYDSMGISGIRAKTMGRFNAAHFKKQLALRAPNLVIINVGTNESEFEGMSMEEYERDYTALLKRVRAALPNQSCLVASPPDRAKRNKAGKLATTPMIPKIVEVQRRVAVAQGCAFWNTYEAMGGEGSMVAWFRHKPRLGSGDYTHFTAAGGEALGVLLADALIKTYEKSSR